jgi:uncharacterized protein (DUF2141 family)
MTTPRRFRAAALLGALSAFGTAVLTAGPAAAAPAGCTGRASDTWINVSVEGVRNSKGLVAITLYADDSSRFLAKKGSLYVGRVPASAGTTRGCIFVPKPGVYAIAIYHDENSSRKFDRTGIGLPAEGYGFSNNPATLAGLPAFRSVRLNMPKSNLTTHISIKYP